MYLRVWSYFLDYLLTSKREHESWSVCGWSDGAEHLLGAGCLPGNQFMDTGRSSVLKMIRFQMLGAAYWVAEQTSGIDLHEQRE